ncbi:hypothetical protein EIO60_03889|nr:hypothetical protein [Candidatus Pantoea persica]
MKGLRAQQAKKPAIMAGKTGMLCYWLLLV